MRRHASICAWICAWFVGIVSTMHAQQTATVQKADSVYDWTLGCVAATNEEIEKVWKLVPVGTQIEIRP
jgi:hypothetical protein